jgi:hypothetical protein
MQTGINAGLGKQAGVRASLNDPAALQHQNQTRLSDGAEPVRDYKRGPAAEQDLQSALQAGFGNGINGARRFV